MLMSESLNLIISRLHWWAVKLKAIIKKKWSWEFALLQFECVACMMCQCAVLLNTKLSSATCLIAVNICWDTEVKYVTDRVHWLSMLVEKDTHNWHGARYHGRHGERRLCAYQMLDALCPVLVLSGAYSWLFYEWRILRLWPGDNFYMFCVSVTKATHYT